MAPQIRLRNQCEKRRVQLAYVLKVVGAQQALCFFAAFPRSLFFKVATAGERYRARAWGWSRQVRGGNPGPDRRNLAASGLVIAF